VRYGTKCEEGFLPIYSVDTEEEARQLLVHCCKRNLHGDFIAPELARSQTIPLLLAFGRRLQETHKKLLSLDPHWPHVAAGGTILALDQDSRHETRNERDTMNHEELKNRVKALTDELKLVRKEIKGKDSVIKSNKKSADQTAKRLANAAKQIRVALAVVGHVSVPTNRAKKISTALSKSLQIIEDSKPATTTATE
jgi:hypothetical protein